LVSVSQSMRGADYEKFTSIRAAWDGLAPKLEDAYNRSLFDPKIIRDWEIARRN